MHSRGHCGKIAFKFPIRTGLGRCKVVFARLRQRRAVKSDKGCRKPSYTPPRGLDGWWPYDYKFGACDGRLPKVDGIYAKRLGRSTVPPPQHSNTTRRLSFFGSASGFSIPRPLEPHAGRHHPTRHGHSWQCPRHGVCGGKRTSWQNTVNGIARERR